MKRNCDNYEDGYNYSYDCGYKKFQGPPGPPGGYGPVGATGPQGVTGPVGPTGLTDINIVNSGDITTFNPASTGTTGIFELTGVTGPLLTPVKFVHGTVTGLNASQVKLLNGHSGNFIIKKVNSLRVLTIDFTQVNFSTIPKFSLTPIYDNQFDMSLIKDEHLVSVGATFGFVQLSYSANVEGFSFIIFSS